MFWVNRLQRITRFQKFMKNNSKKFGMKNFYWTVNWARLFQQLQQRTANQFFSKPHVKWEKLKIAKAEFDTMLHHPTALVFSITYRAQTIWRLAWKCGNYRRLNSETLSDRYLISHIHDFNNFLESRSIFSVIDLVRAYNQRQKRKFRKPLWSLHSACSNFLTWRLGYTMLHKRSSVLSTQSFKVWIFVSHIWITF